MFYESTGFIQVVKATVVAALHVVILVLSKDLGAALIFFIAYMVMLYVATRKFYYFAGGLACGAAAVRWTGGEAVLESLFIDPLVRGRGLGGALADLAILTARERDAGSLTCGYVLAGEDLVAMNAIFPAGAVRRGSWARPIAPTCPPAGERG